MPRISSKRQITLPVDQCRALQIEPGDEVDTYVHNGRITIVKKVPGSAAGRLRHLRADPDISDEDSRDGAIARRGSRRAAGPRQRKRSTNSR